MEERRKKGRERDGGGKLVGMTKNETRQRSKRDTCTCISQSTPCDMV